MMDDNLEFNNAAISDFITLSDKIAVTAKLLEESFDATNNTFRLLLSALVSYENGCITMEGIERSFTQEPQEVKVSSKPSLKIVK